MTKTTAFVDKSYKILFIIYAPFAVVTYLITAYANVEIGYLPLTSVVMSAISVLVAVAIVIAAIIKRSELRKDYEAGIPFILRHRFLIIYVAVSLASFIVSFFYLYSEYDRKKRLTAQQRETIEIVSLIHITNELGKHWEESQLLMQGLGMFVMNKPEVTRQFHFSFVDHKNRYDDALRETVLAEIRRGVDYFICTSSQPCLALAQEFDSLAQLARSGPRRPILVITAAASSQLKTKTQSVYRFYPRSQEQIELLARLGKTKGWNTASYIAIDDAYGRNAVSLFIDQWSGADRKIIPGVFLDPLVSEVRAAEVISEHFDGRSGIDVIFVAHYKNITDGLLVLAPKHPFLVTSGYLEDYVRPHIGAEIDPADWITVNADYKDQAQLFDQLPPSFFYLTLDKLTHTIEQSKNDPEHFHSFWMSTQYPPVLNFERDGEADFKIHLRPKTYAPR